MEITHSDTDIFLLDKLRLGDSSAFDFLFRKYYPLLCAYGTRFVCIEDAEEIATDTLFWVWEHRDEEIVKSSLVKYLLKAVSRKALNQKELAQVKLKADTHFYQDIVADVLEQSDLCEINDLSQRAEKAINNLPETYREAFIMHRFKNMTYKKIAVELDVSVKSVDYKIQQAVKSLTEELKDCLPLLIFLFSTK